MDEHAKPGALPGGRPREHLEVAVGVGVWDGEALVVCVALTAGDELIEAVADAVAVAVGVADGEPVALGLAETVAQGEGGALVDALDTPVCDALIDDVTLTVAVALDVALDVALGDALDVALGVALGVALAAPLSGALGVALVLGDELGVELGVGRADALGDGVGVGAGGASKSVAFPRKLSAADCPPGEPTRATTPSPLNAAASPKPLLKPTRSGAGR
jgi:hypothetical protein